MMFGSSSIKWTVRYLDATVRLFGSQRWNKLTDFTLVDPEVVFSFLVSPRFKLYIVSGFQRHHVQEIY